MLISKLLITFTLAQFLVPHASSLVTDTDCSGHGHYDTEKNLCICEKSWPSSASDQAWVGENCQVPVFLGSDDGSDMASSCARSKACEELKEGEWVCFAIPDSNAPSDWNFLAFLLNRTEGDGDADLYGYGRNTTTPPNFSQTSGFAFSDTSTARTSAVQYRLSKTDFPAGYFDDGYYVCVHNYPGTGALRFSLQATKNSCRVSFSNDGAPLVCSTLKDASEEEKRYTGCTADGECVCKPPYAIPIDTPVTPGLGFESCAARVVMINDDEGSQVYTATDEHLNAQEWRFWGFNTSENDFEVVLTVAERHGRVQPFARFGVPPGAGAGQFDERSEWNAGSDVRKHQIVLDSSVAGTRTGLWFLGIVGAGNEGGSFDLSLQKFSCPGNCSSNGVCDVESHHCTCEDGYGGADCSIFSEELAFNSTVDRNTSSIFEYEYFNMPPATDAMLQGNAELKLTAQWSSDKWNIHLAALPELLISLDADNPGAFPNEKNFTQRVVLDMDRPHTLTLCSSQLIKGPWKVALHNPLPSIPLNYTFAVQKIGRCLNNCSGNGACSDDGVCECKKGYAGGDCSVATSDHPAPGTKHHPFRTFFSSLFLMAIGAAAAFAYVSFRGIPPWLPMQNSSPWNIGMYQELTENEGI